MLTQGTRERERLADSLQYRTITFMSILQIERMTKSYAADVLFDPFSAQLAAGDRVALIGDNGVGKSTLLRILAGLEPPSDGAVRRIGDVRTAYLAQTARLQATGTLREAMERPFDAVRAIEAEMRTLEHAIGEGADDDASLHRYDDLLHTYERLGGYETEARIRAALIGVGFAPEQFDTPVEVLSGGEEAHAALARVLLEAPDLLLLDEPTNHLDFSALDWLEESLTQFSGALLLVSHDRHLLDRVANRTWEIAFETVTVYNVGYSRSRAQRDLDRRQRLEAYARQEETIEKYKDFIRRNKAGQKVRQAKDRERKLARIEEARVERPKDAQRITLRIGLSEASGKRVLSLDGLRVGYEAPLVTVSGAVVYRGEKVAIIGPNGCGKTTLLRTLLDEHPPLAGSFERGHNVRPAAFRQRQEGLHGRGSVLDAVLSRTSLTISEARGLLGRFLFSGDDVDKKMDALSGGERSRVALALLSLMEGNLLLLDEPTNHLDLASQEILERALQAYEGTVLLVSHDRALLEAVTTQVWLIEDGELRVHGVGYAEYRRRCTQDATTKPTSAAGSAHKRRPSAPPDAVRRAAREAGARRAELEGEIETLEAQIEEIEAALVDASGRGDAAAIARLSVEHAAARSAVEAKYGQWNTLAEGTEESHDDDR